MFASGATINALWIFVCAGGLTGIIYDLLSIFKPATSHNILVVNVVDFLCCLVGGLIFIYCIFKYEFGLFALFEVIGFGCGVSFEQIIVKNLFTSPFKWVYNKITLRRSMLGLIQEQKIMGEKK